jgi:cytochrome P450
VLANNKIKDRDHANVGFGRHVCAGMHIGKAELLSSAAAILSAFDIKRLRAELIDTVHYKLFVNHFTFAVFGSIHN